MNVNINADIRNENILHDRFDKSSRKTTVHYLIDECAQQYPDKTAIKFHGRELTYKNLNESANKLAKLLIDSNVKIGDIVGLAVDRSLEMVISLLAILKSGAAYLPLDPEYPKERIEFMLKDSSVKILLTSKKYQAHFRSIATEVLIEDTREKLDGYDIKEPEIEVNGDDLAYVLYTSGSTGKPKGVMIKHYNLVNFLLSMQKEPGINVNDKILAITTISFDIAALELYLPLICGAQIMLTDAETAKDGRLLLDIIKREHISIMQATPYTWRMILEAGWDKFLPVKIICGGEALHKDLVNKLIWRCSALWNQYGPTETTIYSTQKLIKSADDITIGKPIDNTQVYILDECLTNMADGVIGEIFIAGDGVAKGYLNNPELTAERFIDDPFSGRPNDKMYRTGDLGRFNEGGEIQCLGRIDQQVKVRGYRIEPEEIEYTLLKQANIKEAVVIVRDDIPGEPRLVAYLVLAAAENGGGRLQKHSVQQALMDTLPEYMVPDDFVLMSSIPITPNGKIDRKSLPKPEINLIDRSSEYLAPRSDVERLVTRIWEELMGLEKISIVDNFFALGGRSLIAIQIMARIEHVTGKRLPLATLFKHSTIEKLSVILNIDDDLMRWDSLVAIKPGGSKTPMYIIHGEGLNVLYFNTLAINMDKEQPVYGLQAKGLEGDEPLDVMEEIATNYVNEIIAQNPSGPYLLAGYSFGGYIAIEMRKQMVAKGKEVKLIIFDTDAEKSKYKNWLYLLPRKIKKYLPKLISFLKSVVHHPITVLKSEFKNLSQKIFFKPYSKSDSKKFYQQMKKIKDKLRVALHNYSIEPFDDKVYLYKAKICTHYVDDVEFLGWNKYAKKGVEIYEIPGDHLSMLIPPNVEEFALILQRGIDQYSL